MFKRTTAINKILKLKSRVKIVQGGTSAGKTFGILPILINKAINTPMSEISICSESYPHLRRGAMKDFINIMKWTNRWTPKQWNKSSSIFTFRNGSYIEFFSVDDSSKLRGARRDILYINECNNVNFEAYQELSIRTKREVFLDFNPANEFWVHEQLQNEPDTDFIVLTYKDNEALDDRIVKEIEKAKVKGETSEYWANWWRVYGLGELGNLQGVVYNNWKIIDSIPTDAKLLGIGLDFGYTNDPTTMIEVYKWNDKRILNERCYNTDMVNRDIAKKLPKGVLVIADSAEPKSIEEIKRFGIMIKGAKKGTDSVNYGVQIVQSQSYLVTKKSVNLIKEFRGYCWDVDRSGKQLNHPAKGNDHAMDALRYFEMETLGNANYGVYHLR